MTNDRANLVNPKPLGDEVADGLAATVVKVEVVDRGAILDGGIPSAAEQNVERRPCDCEYQGTCSENGIGGYWICRNFLMRPPFSKSLGKDIYCRFAQRHLP